MLDFLHELNKEQYAAVSSDINKHMLVIAGAGTGKTKALVSRYAFLMENHFATDRIMAITFTKKAAEEMQQRISKISRQKLHYHNSWIANFHRIANKILRDNYKAANFDSDNFRLIDRNEQKTLLKNEILSNENLLDADLINFIKICNESENERQKRLQNFYDNVINNLGNDNKENQKIQLVEYKKENKQENKQENNKAEIIDIATQQIINITNISNISNITNSTDLEKLFLDVDKSTADAFALKQILEDINYFKELGIRADDYLLLANNQYVETTSQNKYTIEFLSDYANLIYQFNNCEINETNSEKLNKLTLELFFKGENKLNMQNIFNTQERMNCYKKFYTIYKAYENYCFQNDIVDFSESLLRCYELLRKNKLLLNKYQQQFKHILIDEFQDTNQLQYRWLALLCNNENYFFAVGDDDQSIYKFRGSDVINIALFNYSYAKNNITNLSQNYRSTKNILNAANAVIKHNKYRIIQKDLWTQSNVGNKLLEYTFYDANDEAAFIVNEIKKQVKVNKKYKYADFAILYRNNSFSQNLEKLLLKNNIPYQVVGSFKFYEREEIKNAVAYLQLTANPNDNIAFLRVINIPKRKNGKVVINKIKTIAMQKKISYFQAANMLLLNANNSKKEKGIIEFIDIIKELHSKYIDLQNLMQESKLVNLYKMLLEKTQLINYYAKNQNINTLKGEEKDRVDNLLELFNALENFENESENFDKDLNVLLRDFLDFVTHDATDSDKVGEKKKDKVLLMTVHKSKGLEFTNLYIIGMENGSFPKSNLESIEDLEEERRLAYVAITRARQNLTISYAKNERLFYKANYHVSIKERSMFLTEIPNKFIERIDLSNKSFYFN